MESLWLAVRACAAWDVVVCHIGGRGHTRAGFATTKQRLWLGWQYTVCSGAVTCRFNSSLRGSFVSVHRSRHTKQRFRRTCLHVSANACRSFFHPHRLQSGNKMSFCLRDTVSFFFGNSICSDLFTFSTKSELSVVDCMWESNHRTTRSFSALLFEYVCRNFIFFNRVLYAEGLQYHVCLKESHYLHIFIILPHFFSS